MTILDSGLLFGPPCRLDLGLELDLVSSGWLVGMHTYLYYFPLSLSRCRVFLA